MTIELRQLVVKSTVEDEDKRSFNTAGGCPQEMAQIKEEIMAENVSLHLCGQKTAEPHGLHGVVNRHGDGR
jgi:hypothetical protein